MNKAYALLGVVTRDRACILPKALASALSQTFSGMQIAVTNDGSTDGTEELRIRFPQVRWTCRTISLGYMSARNEMMAVPGPDYFISLDDDAWFMEGDEIKVAVDFLENHKSVAAVAFDILSPDRPDEVKRTGPEPAATFIGCGHVLRLSAVREVGAYESTPGSYGGEEKDLCLRLMDAGYNVVRLPGVHVWHDKAPEAREIPFQHCSGVCNDLVMTLRRTPGFLLPLALPFKFVRHFSFSWKRNLTRPCLEGFRLFLKTAFSIWPTRKPVRLQTLRTFMRISQNKAQS